MGLYETHNSLKWVCYNCVEKLNNLGKEVDGERAGLPSKEMPTYAEKGTDCSDLITGNAETKATHQAARKSTKPQTKPPTAEKQRVTRIKQRDQCKGTAIRS